MPKYYYKAIPEIVDATYRMHTGVKFDKELTVELLVTAENEDASRDIRIGVTDINMWKLDRIED